MADPTSPVSDQDVLEFEGYMLKWQKLLNLVDWRIIRSPTRHKTAMAAVMKRSLSDRLASYRVGMDFKATPVTPESLEATALHEMLHIFLTEFLELARDADTKADVLMSAEHRIINTLEPLLMRLKLETP